MSTVLSSMSEIVRVGGWALRGIGYPFGVAERGVRLLAWTEAVGGEAIRSLRLSEAVIEKSHVADPCQHEGDSSSGRVIHANGRHLLEVGAPAIDLVAHDARHALIGHVAVNGVFGLGFLPSLANLLAHRKLSGVFFYRAAEADRLAGRWSRAGWLVVRSASDRVVFAHGSLEGKTGKIVRSALAGAGSAMPLQLLDGVLKDMEAATTVGTLGCMGVLALSDAHLLARELLETMQSLPEGVEMVDFPRRFADALSNGVPVEAQDLKYLYDLEVRTWAPTSERSRSQAGYGVF